MKKSVRLLAMILCVLSITALLPTVAFAAEPTDEVKPALAEEVFVVKNAAKEMLRANVSSQTFKVSAKLNARWYIQDPYSSRWPVPVKYQWYVKKGSGKSFAKIKGATKYRYVFKATKGKNGWTYRLKVTNKYNKSDYIYLIYKIKVVK